MTKITGTNTYIDVELDGRTARIENEPLTEEDKKEIIQKVTEKTAGSHMVITFE